jgi:hypothetical protein
MINDETNEAQRKAQQWVDYNLGMSPLVERMETLDLLEKAQQLSIQLSFHRSIVKEEPVEWNEYLDWQVIPPHSHSDAIYWMYGPGNVYKRLYTWNKMCWHLCQENQPFPDEEPEELSSS